MRRVNDILFISIGIIDASLLGDLATCRLVDLNALGIEAASFASGIREAGTGH